MPLPRIIKIGRFNQRSSGFEINVFVNWMTIVRVICAQCIFYRFHLSNSSNNDFIESCSFEGDRHTSLKEIPNYDLRRLQADTQKMQIL